MSAPPPSLSRSPSGSASVALRGLTCVAADGTPLFDDLTLAFGPGRTGIVGRNGVGKSTLLRLIAGDLAAQAGQIHVAGRIGRMRQDIGARAGETLADLFAARAALAAIADAAAGRAGPDALSQVDWTLPGRMQAALAAAGLDLAPDMALSQLSGGRRVRAALAALIFDDPDILLLDEPTNMLDADGRRAVVRLLQGWRKPALVVSHDRALLAHMDMIVELSPHGARRYGGNHADYAAQKALEQAAARHDLDMATRQRDQAAAAAQTALERKARKDGAGARSRAKGGQAKVLLDRARDRAEASKGAGARLRAARAETADAAWAEARAAVDLLDPLRMEIPPSGLAPTRAVLALEGVTGGHDPARPVIRDLSLTVTGPERIALTGPNGAGKSTLIALITGALAPLSGRVHRHVPLALLDQDLTLLDRALSLRDNFRALNPHADENAARAALARFRFRGDQGLRKGTALSGGEALRAALACTLGREDPPGLLILDEPTNHLDLEALAALEVALTGWDGALLVVSHDAAFLDRIGLTRRISLAR